MSPQPPPILLLASETRTRRQRIIRNPRKSCFYVDSLFLLFSLIILIVLILDGSTINAAEEGEQQQSNKKKKEYQICAIAGGISIASETSKSIQIIFQNALEDVTMMKEFIIETMTYHNGKGITSQQEGTTTTADITTEQDFYNSLITLDELNISLDWEIRNVTSDTTTVEMGLGYVDDSPKRRVERIVGLAEEPKVGSKSSDLAMIDILKPVLPWILDRRSKRDFWYKDHSSIPIPTTTTTTTTTNTTNDEDESSILLFDQLYIATYAVTFGSNTAIYYPPMTSFVPRGFTLNDVLGDSISFYNDSAVYAVLPEQNPLKQSIFGTPYADRANPGLSIVSAMSPIYYTGSWYGFDTYNNTLLGLVGIDISITSISKLLHQLDGTTTSSNSGSSSSSSTDADTTTQSIISFGMVVDINFNVYVITQHGVNLIYPKRTGMEEFRVVRDEGGFGTIIDDRRNQTYLVSDTILQSPLNLTNANWMKLQQDVLLLGGGGRYRGYTEIDILLRDDTISTSFYVMYDKWSTIGDYTLLVFAPKDNVDQAINCTFEQSEIELETIIIDNDDSDDDSDEVTGEIIFQNHGILDVTVTVGNIPDWIQLVDATSVGFVEDEEIYTKVHLLAGEQMTIPFVTVIKDNQQDAENRLRIGRTSSLFTLLVEDDDYRDCFYSQIHSVTLSIKVRTKQDLQQLHSFRIYGFIVSGMIVITSIICFLWVVFHRGNTIVNASQPIFLHILSFGTMILGLSILPLSIDDSLTNDDVCDVACMVFPWTFCLGFSIAFAAIFSKVWRVNQLMTASTSFARRQLTARDVITPFFIIFTLNVGLLLSWTMTHPLVWNRVEDETDESSSHGTCWSNLNGTQITILTLLVLINFMVLILAIVQAYYAKHIADEFSESKYIFLSNFGMLQVTMIGTPVMFLVGQNPRALFFVQSSLVFLITWPLQLLIFIPKVHYVWKHRRDDSRQLLAAAVRSSTIRKSNAGASSEISLGFGSSGDSKTPLGGQPGEAATTGSVGSGLQQPGSHGSQQQARPPTGPGVPVSVPKNSTGHPSTTNDVSGLSSQHSTTTNNNNDNGIVSGTSQLSNNDQPSVQLEVDS